MKDSKSPRLVSPSELLEMQSAQSAAMPSGDDAPKRGPGRPPGAKNKARTLEERDLVANAGERTVPAASLPGWDAEDIRLALRKYNRAPFQDLLSVWLETAPDVQTLRAWARKYPDRWAMAVGQLAKVAGFSERREVTNFQFDVAALSDSQLEDQMIQIARFMGVESGALLEAVTAVMLEGSAIEVEPDQLKSISRSNPPSSPAIEDGEARNAPRSVDAQDAELAEVEDVQA